MSYMKDLDVQRQEEAERRNDPHAWVCVTCGAYAIYRKNRTSYCEKHWEPQ